MNALVVESQKQISEVLNNIEAELLQVGQLLARLQVTFSPFLHAATCTNEFHRDAQSLDLAAQQVIELSVVMSNLGAIAAPEWLVATKDTVAGLKLQALADRICGCSIVNGDEASGKLELL